MKVLYTPESWTKGIIDSMPKKRNLNDVNNYRGITLTRFFKKITSLLHDNRRRKYAETISLLSVHQFGFRKQKSTTDCIFILHSVINKIIMVEKNRKLFCTFVEFRKAFDLVYRNGMWYKFINRGVSCMIINMLQAIYKSVKFCVRIKGCLSDLF